MTRKKISSTPEITIIADDLLIPVVDTSRQPDDSGRHIRASIFATAITPMVANVIIDSTDSAINASISAENSSVTASGYANDSYYSSVAASGYADSAEYYASIALSATISPYSIVSGTVLLDDTYEIIEAYTLTEIIVPTAIGRKGKRFIIIRTGTENVTITPSFSETINGEIGLVIITQWESVVIYSNGINWIRVQ